MVDPRLMDEWQAKVDDKMVQMEMLLMKYEQEKLESLKKLETETKKWKQD